MPAALDSRALSTFFEVGMLVCFGASWPFAVLKTYMSKSTGGKSATFLWLVLMGYFSGIMFKVFGRLDWVVGLYALNGFMVALDIALYYRYKLRGGNR